jgi:hypothetical protein
MILKVRPKADPLNAQQRTAKAAATIHLCYHHPKPNQAVAPHSIQNKQRKAEQRLITDMGTHAHYTPQDKNSTNQNIHQKRHAQPSPKFTCFQQTPDVCKYNSTA